MDSNSIDHSSLSGRNGNGGNGTNGAKGADLDVLRAETASEAVALDLEQAPVVPIRQASISVADAIDSVLDVNSQRHESVRKNLATLRDRQAEAEKHQQELTGMVGQLGDQQKQFDSAQKTLSETVDSILANQKTSRKSYREVMDALGSIQAAVQAGQQETDDRLAQIETSLSKRIGFQSKLIIGLSIGIAALVIVSIVVG